MSLIILHLLSFNEIHLLVYLPNVSVKIFVDVYRLIVMNIKVFVLSMGFLVTLQFSGFPRDHSIQRSEHFVHFLSFQTSLFTIENVRDFHILYLLVFVMSTAIHLNK